jgi:hypothetical protein
LTVGRKCHNLFYQFLYRVRAYSPGGDLMLLNWTDLIVKLLSGVLVVGFVVYLIYSQLFTKRKK